jgi:N-acetylglucosamine-6-sulfatase
MVLNIDIAPTLLDLAGQKIPASIEGHSLVPLFKGRTKRWRAAFVIEYFSDRVFPRIANMGYQALRTERWKYIRYRELEGMDELYDLKNDRYELTNLVATRQAEAARLKRQLARQIARNGAGR